MIRVLCTHLETCQQFWISCEHFWDTGSEARFYNNGEWYKPYKDMVPFRVLPAKDFAFIVRGDT